MVKANRHLPCRPSPLGTSLFVCTSDLCASWWLLTTEQAKSSWGSLYQRS